MKCISSIFFKDYQSEQVTEPANNHNILALLQMRKKRVLIRDIQSNAIQPAVCFSADASKKSLRIHERARPNQQVLSNSHSFTFMSVRLVFSFMSINLSTIRAQRFKKNLRFKANHKFHLSAFFIINQRQWKNRLVEHEKKQAKRHSIGMIWRWRTGWSLSCNRQTHLKQMNAMERPVAQVKVTV